MSDDIKGLMEESPVPDNHGRAVGTFVDEDGGATRTKRDLASRMAGMSDRGFGIDGTTFGVVSGKDEGGLVAHRGVLHPDEYVDFFVLRERFEDEFGTTYAAIAAAYANGRPTAEQRQLRDEIDARLLALSRAGGNMEQLAKAVGVSEKTVDRAVARAKDVEIVPIVRDPAVTTVTPCFLCAEPGRKRKRKSPDTPADRRGYVVLCDDHYAAGFEPRKGNPAYWRFRDDRTPLRWPTRPAKAEQRFPVDYPNDESYQDFLSGERRISVG